MSAPSTHRQPAWVERAAAWLEGERTSRLIVIFRAVSRAELRVIHDDGFAVWVNGVLVANKYVANGTSHSAYASGWPADNEETAATIPPSAFHSGDNIIAYMVKQGGGGSSDLSFDLDLTLTVGSSATSQTTPIPAE